MVGRGVLRFKKGVCSKRVSGSVVLEAFSSRARFICTTVVQIGVAVLVGLSRFVYDRHRRPRANFISSSSSSSSSTAAAEQHRSRSSGSCNSSRPGSQSSPTRSG